MAGSFRDPAGFVFTSDGVIYRQVNAVSRDSYDLLMRSGLYDALVTQRLLIPHAEVAAPLPYDGRAYKILRPEPVRFISYPYEWCFGQLKDAALATLKIQRTAIAHGMSLKDCSAYNVQFSGGQPIFIDTLSFEPYREGQPWVAYRQFCQQFVAPLALMSLVDVRFGQVARLHIDGVPLDLASRLLPTLTWFRPRLLLHLHLHAVAIARFGRAAVGVRREQPMSRAAMLGLVDNLQRTIESIRWNPAGSTWSAYEHETNYSSEARTHKEEIVQAFLTDSRPQTVWDLGCNSGRFSRMAAAMRADTVAFDADYGATELNYRACRTTGETRILPLVIDLTNPSPALGWAHAERLSWAQRGPADTVLALALVHHLALGNNVPLPRIAELLRSLGTHVIVEFVPKSDSQVQRLLATREDVFPDYSQEGFERAFEPCFHVLQAIPVRESERVMYLMRKR